MYGKIQIKMVSKMQDEKESKVLTVTLKDENGKVLNTITTDA